MTEEENPRKIKKRGKKSMLMKKCRPFVHNVIICIDNVVIQEEPKQEHHSSISHPKA